MVEHLCRMHKALGSLPNKVKKIGRKKIVINIFIASIFIVDHSNLCNTVVFFGGLLILRNAVSL